MDAGNANGFTDSEIKAAACHDDGSAESNRSERLERLRHTIVFTSKNHKIHNPSKMQDLNLNAVELDADGSTDCESYLSSELETLQLSQDSSSFMNKAFAYVTSDDDGYGRGDASGNSSADCELSNSILNTALLDSSTSDTDMECSECSYFNSTFEIDTSMEGRSRLSVIFEEDSIDLLLYDNEDASLD